MLRASAGALPFDAGSVAAVLGLCVFDAIADQDAAVAEAARVLSPGGRFVHFMDMATLLETPFAKLHASNLVPIPNVFGDPGDHEWPLDIVLLARDWLDGVLARRDATGHPLAATLNATFAPFLGRRRSTSRRRPTRSRRSPPAATAAASWPRRW